MAHNWQFPKGIEHQCGFRKRQGCFEDSEKIDHCPSAQSLSCPRPAIISEGGGQNRHQSPTASPAVSSSSTPPCLDAYSSRPSPTPPEGVRGLAVSELRVTPCTILLNHHLVPNPFFTRAESPRIVQSQSPEEFDRPLYFISFHFTGEDARSQCSYETDPGSHLPSINDSMN